MVNDAQGVNQIATIGRRYGVAIYNTLFVSLSATGAVETNINPIIAEGTSVWGSVTSVLGCDQTSSEETGGVDALTLYVAVDNLEIGGGRRYSTLATLTIANDDPGCFLTEACVGYAGLPDNCVELTTLRQFRDSYVAHLQEGPRVLLEYRRVGPMILAGIKRSPGSSRVLKMILGIVRLAMLDIQNGQYQVAYMRYSEMVEKLKKKYAVK
jgi:hypothetical protein